MTTITPPFNILFVLYHQATQLDFAGPLEVFSSIPNTKIRFASPLGGDLEVQPSLTFRGIERLADVESCDLICVPGGRDPSSLDTPEMHGHIQRLCLSAKYITSVCNGSLVLAKAGVLKGKRSACHWAFGHQLAQHGAIFDPARVVHDGKFMSGAGVTSGIDFGLAAAVELVGAINAQAIQLEMEYAPQPPFNSGSPETAPPEVIAAFNATFGEAYKKIGGRLPLVKQ
jgi:cyclohexyl-isocyanide hydratase